MINSYYEHRTVDELRLADIEDFWEKCREEQASILACAESGTERELRDTIFEADSYINHLLEEMVPELIVSLRRSR